MPGKGWRLISFLWFPSLRNVSCIEILGLMKSHVREVQIMVRNMTLGKRMVSGIVLMLALMVIVGLAGYFGMKRMSAVTGMYTLVGDLQMVLATVKEHTDAYTLASQIRDKKGQDQAVKKVSIMLKKGQGELEKIKVHPALDEDSRPMITEMEKGINGYRAFFQGYIQAQETKKKLEKSIGDQFNAFIGWIQKGELFIEQMDLSAKIFQSDFVAFCSQATDERWKKLQKGSLKADKEINLWYEKIKGSDQIRAAGDEIKKRYIQVSKGIKEYHAAHQEQNRIQQSITKTKNALNASCTELGKKSMERLNDQTRFSMTLIFGFILAALVIGIGYAALSTRSIVGRIKKVITGIADGAEQVATEASQVSISSQELAEGASEQAASLEETSSSLEEMSSMTKQNAEHAHKAREMMNESSVALDKVDRHMNDMAESIEQINASSEETVKIVKTIDEIAFQTNLLALNAAVEAARAGEAGAGFAVVADEVRNLAMRASEAAKNTSDLIEKTIHTVRSGKEITLMTKDAFVENMEIAKKVAGLVDEIAEASGEQADGIEQVNKAVNEMDKVIQQNAAGAEESAGSAQQMNRQAEHLEQYVNELASIVGSVHRRAGLQKEKTALSESAAGHTSEEKTTTGTSLPEGREVTPARALPQGDDGFQDF
jgi:methyl-accepting chemotaxis protein